MNIIMRIEKAVEGRKRISNKTTQKTKRREGNIKKGSFLSYSEKHFHLNKILI